LLTRGRQAESASPASAQAEPATGAAPSFKSAGQSEPDIQHLVTLVHLLEDFLRVPGTKWRIGLDGLLGLVPGVGDLIGALIATYVLKESARLGVSRTTLARMAGNIALDFALGAMPLVGDIFDMAFKANRRNLKLLRRHLERAQRVSKG